jgi:TATA-box binding protein (TBP) (component of TFIID and TFIIIB)
MNCFVIILRILYEESYKELNIKVFNTGKLEIPGIRNDTMLHEVLVLVVETLKPYVITDSDNPLNYLENENKTVLINSNFNCGIHIDREKLYKKLKYTYNINTIYDSCSYPGIHCRFYFDIENEDENEIKNDCNPIVNIGKNKVSFMIFRTGSILIVGKCSRYTIYKIYDYICDILKKECLNIQERNSTLMPNIKKSLKIKKNRKKYIII